MNPFEIRRAESKSLFEELSSLKSSGYNVLVDMTAVDYSAYPEPKLASGRFEVVYRLACLDAGTGLETKSRVEIYCAVGTEPVLRSVASLWPAADWLEREVWDMFGVGFVDRPNLKRLLMYESFVGHPLRKDYLITKRQPLIGPPLGEPMDNPSFNSVKPAIKYQ